MQERVRVGAAQVAPHFFDKGKTLEKTVRLIEDAGRLGLDLLVFPETYFAAYPYWRGSVSVRRSTELIVEMQRHAIRADGEEARVIADAAQRAKVHCVVGCNELDDRPGSLTLYNTLLFVGRDGKILGRHRKLMPTHSERVYWGMGDAADIRVFNLDIGVVGGLICYEHHMTLRRVARLVEGGQAPGRQEPRTGIGDLRHRTGHPGVRHREPGLRGEFELVPQTRGCAGGSPRQHAVQPGRGR
jgi:amidase/nitrilase